MWDMRVTEINDTALLAMLQLIGGSYIVVSEGEPYDPGIKAHHHIFLISDKSESFIRKRLQRLDPSRKGNELYSLKKSHENSPNYVLKKVFKDSNSYNDWVQHPRLIFISDQLRTKIGSYYSQYEAYMETIKVEKKLRKFHKKNSTFTMIQQIADKYVDQDVSSPNNFIRDVLDYHEVNQLVLPSRSNMERHINSIWLLVKKNHLFLENYYWINYPSI